MSPSTAAQPATAPLNTYSCVYSYAVYYPSDEERANAKKALERALVIFAPLIEWGSAGKSIEWVLMGKLHALKTEEVVHWTVRAFCGNHAAMTFHLDEGGANATLYMNGGKWEVARSRGEFFAMPW